MNVDPVQWFLNDRHDTRSSYYLEDAATEFQVQGLELDWVCVTWDADLRRHADSWRYQSFRGDAWTTIHKGDRKRYLLNAYRVLLTRARQGMIVFVPPGDPSDPTRAVVLRRHIPVPHRTGYRRRLTGSTGTDDQPRSADEWHEPGGRRAREPTSFSASQSTMPR